MPDLDAYRRLRDEANDAGAVLVAVSKTKPDADLEALYRAGHRDFGENYVQELVGKQARLPEDIHWHFIGHLQRNKVREIVPFVHLIHGVDSLRLLAEINKRARAIGRIVDVLLQVHVAQEDTKHGWAPEELLALYEEPTIHGLAWVRPCGLMGMASNTDDEARVSAEFAQLKSLYDTIGERYYDRRPAWSTLSMGMSGDYRLALAAGSTLLRIGSTIFGARA